MDAPWPNDEGERRKPRLAAPTKTSRRNALTGVSVLAMALALAACSADPPPRPMFSMRASTMLGSRYYAPPLPRNNPLPPPHYNSELRDAIDGTHDVVIAGEHVNTELLRHFYARHDYEPVWSTRRDQASELMATVLRAGDQGLDPDRFHAAKLQHGQGLSALDRELLLSDAFLTYADALARGAVPVEHRRDDQVLTPAPVDVAAVLDSAIRSSDPGNVIESLAPTTLTYLALREALQLVRSGPRDGGKASAGVLRTITVNLERQRWLPRVLPADRAWVNVADERLVLYRSGDPVFTTRVVVGEDITKNQSPEFSATIDASFYNPPWVIPADIAKVEILPKVTHDPDYLKKNKMVLLAGGEVEQLPGPEAGLGYIMFDMPNKFDVYLHDTPDREIFLRDNRRLSHGCIRVQNPREFAAQLTDQSLDEINDGIAKGDTTRNDLSTPVPVFVVYQTAFVDTEGKLQMRPDFYSRDAAIWQKLQERPQARVVSAQAENRGAAARAL